MRLAASKEKLPSSSENRLTRQRVLARFCDEISSLPLKVCSSVRRRRINRSDGVSARELAGWDVGLANGHSCSSVRLLSRMRKLETVRSEILNILTVGLKQNKWLDEILGRFEEIALPDSWLVAGCMA